MSNIRPAFSENFCVMAMSCSNEYVPYLSVCLESILNVSEDTHNYDIIILEKSISQHNKNKLTQQVKRKNFSLRFINPSNIISEYKLKFHKGYAIECYFRLSSPELLCNYEKIIFTDVDLVFMKDPYLLYTCDIKNYPLGACKDLMFGAFLNYKNEDWKDYCKYILKLDHPYEYFNTGVMLFNIEKLNDINFSKNILTIVSDTLFRILEQDGINFLFKNNIKYLDSRWNYPVESNAYKHLVADMPKDFKIDYKRCKNDPFVIHWAGLNKPWKFLDEEYADIWWKYARATPFYEEIIGRLISHKNSRLINSKEFRLSYVMNHLLSFSIKRLRYRLLKHIFKGERRKKYQQKYEALSSLIKEAKALRKKWNKF